jgi:hypothetical protein
MSCLSGLDAFKHTARLAVVMLAGDNYALNKARPRALQAKEASTGCEKARCNFRLTTDFGMVVRQVEPLF